MLTVLNLRTLIKKRSPSLLSHLCKRVRCLTTSGKGISHQKPNKMEYSPAPSRKLSPTDVNVGIWGMMWAIGVSYTMFDSRRRFLWKDSISWCIVVLILYLNFHDEPDGQLSSLQSWCALLGPLLNKEKYQFWGNDRYCRTWETCLQVVLVLSQGICNGCI